MDRGDGGTGIRGAGSGGRGGRGAGIEGAVSGSRGGGKWGERGDGKFFYIGNLSK